MISRKTSAGPAQDISALVLMVGATYLGIVISTVFHGAVKGTFFPVQMFLSVWLGALIGVAMLAVKTAFGTLMDVT